jgi:hypothetical protein
MLQLCRTCWRNGPFHDPSPKAAERVECLAAIEASQARGTTRWQSLIEQTKPQPLSYSSQRNSLPDGAHGASENDQGSWKLRLGGCDCRLTGGWEVLFRGHGLGLTKFICVFFALMCQFQLCTRFVHTCRAHGERLSSWILMPTFVLLAKIPDNFHLLTHILKDRSTTNLQ